MTQAIIFLHGKQADKDNPKYEIVKNIAKKRNAELIGINAPLPYKSGFMWFDKVNRLGEEAVREQFNYSLNYLLSEINEIIKERNLTFDNLILSGHSQGGFMAAYLGITYGAKEVITICSDYPQSFDKPKNLRKDVLINWVEAGKEDYLSQDRIESYKRLIGWGCNLKHLVDANSTHNDLSHTIVDLL
ncbi:MAG: hypothetical protein LBR70_03785 [Lactobacillaceae bacterium]|jgi:predicted esterase|nr:hypothetical protein [Lactobacillaceae bacterium]